MNFEVPFNQADIDRAEQIPVTPALYASSTFVGIQGLVTFDEEYIIPILQSILTPTDREKAFQAVYYRMFAHLKTLYKLDAPVYFQSIAAAARSFFELYLDLALLHRDTSDESIDRFHTFTRVERYRVAQAEVSFFDANPTLLCGNITAMRNLSNNATVRAEIEADVERLWGRNDRGRLRWPKHWSRYQDARARAGSLGPTFEALYVRYYYELSWHIHPGATGVGGIPQNHFDIFVGIAHALVLEIAPEAFLIAGREFHLNASFEAYDEKVVFLKRIPDLHLTNLRLQKLGEPLRFRF
jgi:hypothetical protein